MIPLYVRNTLLEKNGTTPGGDQTYDTMSTDRRYTHYMGRPLNRFEPDGDKHMLTTMSGLSISSNKSDTFKKLSNISNSNLLSESSIYSITTASSNTTTKHNMKHSTINNNSIMNKKLNDEKLSKQRKEYRDIRKIIHQEMEKAKDLPLSHSLVRMAFKDPLPSLTELKYLDEI